MRKEIEALLEPEALRTKLIVYVEDFEQEDQDKIEPHFDEIIKKIKEQAEVIENETDLTNRIIKLFDEYLN